MMPFKVTTRGNGITNSRIHNYTFDFSFDPDKLKKYLVTRNGVRIYCFMFQLARTDRDVKLIWEGGT